MYFIFTDETNRKESRRVEFFLFGAVLVEVEKLPELSDGLREIKKVFDIPEREAIKFSPTGENRKADGQSRIDLQNAVIDLALKLNLTTIVSLVHHKIAKNTKIKELQDRTAASVFVKANEFLRQSNQHGVIIADNWPHDGGNKFFQRILSEGVTYSSNKSDPIERILLIAQSKIETCQFISVIDVILGALKHIINKQELSSLQRDRFGKICRTFWRRKVGKQYTIRDYGINFRPSEVRSNVIKARYDELISFLDSILNSQPR